MLNHADHHDVSTLQLEAACKCSPRRHSLSPQVSTLRLDAPPKGLVGRDAAASDRAEGRRLALAALATTRARPLPKPTRVVMAIRISKHRGSPAAPAVLQLPTDGSVVTIGRAASNAISLAGDQSVSATHAELRRAVSGEWMVRDLGSSNGTALRLSAERVPSRAYAVRPGHRLAPSAAARRRPSSCCSASGAALPSARGGAC